MKKHFRHLSALGLAAFLSGTALQAYDVEYTDKKIDDSPAEFKMDGVIFTGYEFLDEDESGDPQGETGFFVKRAYVNLRTKIKDGLFKGADFRITGDGGVLAEDVTTTPNDNDQIFQLKYAYFSLPVFPGAKIRMGQQHVPGVDGQAGVSLQKYWGHRYIDKVATEDMGMSSSTDKGLAFIYKNPYFGAHLLYANGEGYHKKNAQTISDANLTGLRGLAVGNTGNDSYGYDLYGMISAVPTGENEAFELSINFPFRLQNIAGMHHTEHKYYGVDLNGSSAELANGATWAYYSGEKRAFQDQWYGYEVDAKVKQGLFEMTVGGGTIYWKDQRGMAYKLTSDTFPGTGGGNGVNFSLIPNIDSNIKYEQDTIAHTDQAFIHFKIGPVGAFARIIRGQGRSGKLSSYRRNSNPAWLLYTIDEADYQSGNLNFATVASAIGGSTGSLADTWYEKNVFGITLHANDRTNISLGMSEQRDSEEVLGNQTVTNPYSNVGCADPSSATCNNVPTQVANNTGWNAAILPPGEALPLTLVGTPKVNRQIFIRAEYNW